MWQSHKRRLQALLQQVDQHSLYVPAVLVVVCPDDVLSVEAETKVRAEVSENAACAPMSLH